MFHLLRSRRGVFTVELAVFFACLVIALTIMAKYFQRAAQGGIKSNADSLGSQFSANSPFTVHSTSSSTETASTVNQGQESKFDQTLQ